MSSQREDVIVGVSKEAARCLEFVLAELEELKPGEHDEERMPTIVLMDIRNLQKNCRAAISAIRDYSNQRPVQSYYF